MCPWPAPHICSLLFWPTIADHEEVVLLIPDADVTQKSLPQDARKAPEVEEMANELALFLGQQLRFLPG